MLSSIGALTDAVMYTYKDFFNILLENDGVISIWWQIGNEKGNASLTGLELGFSQLHIARYI